MLRGIPGRRPKPTSNPTSRRKHATRQSREACAVLPSQRSGAQSCYCAAPRWALIGRHPADRKGSRDNAPDRNTVGWLRNSPRLVHREEKPRECPLGYRTPPHTAHECHRLPIAPRRKVQSLDINRVVLSRQTLCSVTPQNADKTILPYERPDSIRVWICAKAVHDFP